MLNLDDLKPGLSVVGLEPAVVATLVAVIPIAEGTVEAIYKTPDGTPKSRLLNRADETSISIATVERPWSFDGDGSSFHVACEAKRIDLTFLFDPMGGSVSSRQRRCTGSRRIQSRLMANALHNRWGASCAGARDSGAGNGGRGTWHRPPVSLRIGKWREKTV